MIDLKKLDGDVVRLTSVGPPRTAWELFDYNPVLERYSSLRTLDMTLTGEYNALEKLFAKYPDARIQNIIAHEPYINQEETEMIAGQLRTLQDIAAWKRIKDEIGVDYIDCFGFHVYIHSTVDFTGKAADIDLRYND